MAGAGGSGGRGGFGRGGFGGRGGGGFGAQDYASPVAASGKIYYVKSDGTTLVIKAGDQFELVSANKTTDANETFSGTPAISDGRIYLKSEQNLFCIKGAATGG